MKIGLAALTDTQRVVLASGKALAEELGLTEFTQPTREIVIPESDKALLESFGLTESSYTVPSYDFEFHQGQTVLVASPQGTNVGVIKVGERQFGNSRSLEYILNGETLCKKNQRFREGKWENLFSPDMNIPANSTLYVS
jgi:hypothetical protein